MEEVFFVSLIISCRFCSGICSNYEKTAAIILGLALESTEKTQGRR